MLTRIVRRRSWRRMAEAHRSMETGYRWSLRGEGEAVVVVC